MFDDRVITPRDYQAKAVSDTLAAFDAGDPGVLIRLPTGTGKTITAGLIVKNWLRRSPQHRVMVLCHEIQLIDQFAKELWDVAGYTAAIEQGSRRASGRDNKLVVASRNTLAERIIGDDVGTERRVSRLGKFDWQQPWLVVVDECCTADTLCHTDRGYERIADMRDSREVLSFDGSRSVWRKIVRWIERNPKDVVKVSLDGGRTIRCTDNHPLFTNAGWCNAGESVGKSVLCYDVHRGTYYDQVVSVTPDGHEPVYDIEVEGTHCFFANGMLVHNCHKYSRSLKTCGHVFDWFAQNPNSRRLGITATPWRTDKISLGTLFPHVAVDYRLMTFDGTPNAVDDGWCVPYEQHYVVVEDVDFKQVKASCGDWSDEDLARLLAETRTLAKYVDPTLQLVGDRPTLIFCPTVDMAKTVSAYINARTGTDCARQVDGTVSHDERRTLYQQFEAGVFRYLAVTGLCREGYDNPSIGAVAIFRPTKSTSLLEQMCGRGCRPLRGTLEGLQTPHERRAAIAASRKPTCLIVNLTGSTGLAGAATAATCYLDGLPDDVVARTEAKMTQGVKNVGDALRDVQAEIAEEERQKEKARERRERDAQRRRERAQRQADLDAQVQYSSHVINPYSGVSVQSASNFGNGSMATEKQLRVLWRAGISASPDKLTKKEAGMLVGMVLGRKTSINAIKVLARKLQDGQKKQPVVTPIQAAPAAGGTHAVGAVQAKSPPASTEPDWGQVFPLFRQ